MLRRAKRKPVKISIVTPSFNSARHIRETIQSVITQCGDFSIEYFVVDNCSTDGTKEIVEEYQHSLEKGRFQLGCNGVDLNFVSEEDKGMYDAVNKGFANANGDVFAWINADDIYLPGAFAMIAKVFDSYDDIHWVKGITSYITDKTFIRQAKKRCAMIRFKRAMFNSKAIPTDRVLSYVPARQRASRLRRPMLGKINAG